MLQAASPCSLTVLIIPFSCLQCPFKNSGRLRGQVVNFLFYRAAILPGGLSHVFEFRHESWLDHGVFDLLQHHDAGFCIFDMPDFTTPLEVTADFAYVRFHGSTWMYGGCYSDTELSDWARRIGGLAEDVRAAYVYFNNDAEGFAVKNALTLAQKLSEMPG